MSDLQKPRHISTLPKSAYVLAWRPGLPTVRCTPNSRPMWLAIGFFAYGPIPELLRFRARWHRPRRQRVFDRKGKNWPGVPRHVAPKAAAEQFKVPATKLMAARRR